MAFEPISGTIGAMALLDPALRGFSWTYGKYKLLKQFGDHYMAEAIKYRSEVARFVYIRDLKTDAFKNSPLNESETFFIAAFRDRLILAVETLEECEELVAKHDPGFLKGEPKDGDPTPGPTQLGFQLENEAIGKVLPSPDPPTDSSASLQSADIVTEPATTDSTLSTSTSGSSQSKGKSSTFRSFFSFQTVKKGKKQSSTGSAATQQLDLASMDLRERQKVIDQSRIQQQEESRLAERLKWIAAERSRFLYLNKEIRKHNDYFLSFTRPWESREHREPSLTPKNKAISGRTKNIATHLQRLIRSLGAIKHSDGVTFQMMLLESPFELRSLMGNALPTEAFLRPSSAMFPFKILKNIAQASNESVNPVKATTSVIFEVPFLKQTSEDVKQQVMARQKIETFADIFAQTTPDDHNSSNDDDSPWWSVIGNINDSTTSAEADESSEPISIFHDRASYLETKSLRASFSDPDFSNLATATYLIYRLRLAYILASSFTYLFLADCPLDHNSLSLMYYSETKADSPPNTHQLAESRLSPYITLRAIGTPQSAPRSFSSVLSRNVNLASKYQILLHRLGILLCEVGRWKPIVAEEASAEEEHPAVYPHDWRGLTSEARILSVDLVRCATSGYQRVVNACLEFAPQEEEKTLQVIREWLEGNVLLPLKKELDGLGPEFKVM